MTAPMTTIVKEDGRKYLDPELIQKVEAVLPEITDQATLHRVMANLTALTAIILARHFEDLDAALMVQTKNLEGALQRAREVRELTNVGKTQQ
jgi:hypothetical protein